MRLTRTVHQQLGRLLALALVTATFVATGLPPASAGSPIDVVRVKGGLRQPAAFSFLPGGKIVYLERATGRVRILNLQNEASAAFLHDQRGQRQR